MVEFITTYISTHIPSAKVEVDRHKNIYVTKGTSDTYPVIVAHTDTVHKLNDNITIVSGKGIVFGYDFKAMEPTGIGADDKNGIYIALRALNEFAVIKAAFFVEEEIGCLGSTKANMDFFENARFVLQADRKNASDFINCASGTDLCTKAFIDDCKLENFGYKLCNGLSTDVMKLKQKGLKVCCVNISCGYYHPHTSTECTNLKDLENCWNFIKNILINCTKVYKHTYIPITYTSIKSVAKDPWDSDDDDNLTFWEKYWDRSFCTSTKKQTATTVKKSFNERKKEITKSAHDSIIKLARKDMETYVKTFVNPSFYAYWKACGTKYPEIGYFELSELYRDVVKNV